MFRCHDVNRVLLHPIAGPLDLTAFAFRSDDPAPAFLAAIVDRLIDYYHRLVAEFTARNHGPSMDMWHHIVGHHQVLEGALRARDREQASGILANLCSHEGLVFGLLNYTCLARELAEDPLVQQQEGLFLLDKLLALAESLGVLPAQNPEQGHWGYGQIDIAALLSQIQRRVPFDMSPPQAGGGAFGIRANAGVLCMKDVQAIYACNRIGELLGSAEEKSVCEIGGGLGILACYLAKSGVDRVAVFDLPTVSIMQAYFLVRSLGFDRVSLHGEYPRARVHLAPYWALEDEPAKSHSLMINLDSLPEIEAGTALNYLRLIKEKGRRHFWSVNQEGQANNAGAPQNLVGDLAERAGGFRRIQRVPHWLRAGWIEELYEIG